jgi:hypothetical protein
MKTPLAALLNAHNKLGGEKLDIQVATLADGLAKSVGTVRGDTPAKFEAKAYGFCAGDYSRVPDSGHTCFSCPYLFPCNKRPTEDD